MLLVFSLLIIAGGELVRPLKMLDDRPGGPYGAPILVEGCPARSAVRASGFCGVAGIAGIAGIIVGPGFGVGGAE